MTSKIRKLETQLATTTDQQQEIDILNTLTWELRDSKPKQAFSYAQRANELARQYQFETTSYRTGLALSLSYLGYLNHYNAKYDQALSLSLEALSIFQEIEFLEGMPVALYIIGMSYLRLGNYSEALPYHRESLAIANQINDLEGQARALNGIAIVNVWSSDHEQAVTFFEESLQIYRKIGDKSGESIALVNLCMSHRDLEHYETSLEFGFRCLEISQELGNKRNQIVALENIGCTYIQLAKNDDALQYFHKALDLIDQIDDKYVQVSTLLHAGRAYHKEQQLALAGSYLHQALMLAEESEQQGFQFECHQALAEIYKEQSDFEQALRHYEQFHELKETVFNEEAASKLRGLESLHLMETAKKEAEIFQLQNVALEREITERKRAEAILRESEARFKAIAQAITIPLIIVRRSDGIILYANQPNEVLFGLKTEDMVGRKTPDFYVDLQDRQRSLALLDKQGYIRDHELQLKKPDDSLVWINHSIQPITFDGQSALLASFFDITEHKAAARKLQEYADRLEDMVTERTRELELAQERLIRQEKLAVMGQLAGGVGHELRNPLSVISNAVYLLQASFAQDDNSQHEYLDIIADRVIEAEKIISDLLDFSRIQPGDIEPTVVSALVAEILERYPPPDEVTVTTKLDPQLPRALIDPQQIVQVVANLITNAYQAMPEGGNLTIRAHSNNQEEIHLSIADTGHGMAQETIEQIFEPLFTTKSTGIGLGLVVTKHLVEMNNGCIMVESTEGQGSTFIVTLPQINTPQ